MNNKRFLADIIGAALIALLFLIGIFFVLRDIGDGKICAGPLKTERITIGQAHQIEAGDGSGPMRAWQHLAVSHVFGTRQVNKEARQASERPDKTMPGLP